MSEEQPQHSLKPPLQNTSSPRDNEPEEIKKLLKWQEDRLQKKLSGQHESAVLHLSQVLNENLSTPHRLSAVRVNGAHLTRDSFLGFIINPLLPSNDSSLESVLHATRHISHRLYETDMFHNVDAKIERARDALAGPDDLDIILNVKEKGRWFAKTSTELGNNEGSAAITARARNVFGGAEIFEANVSYGTTTKKSFQGTFSAPISSDLSTRAELSGFGLQKDHTSFASCEEEIRGVRALIRRGLVGYGVHEFGYEGVLRNVGGLAPTASMSIREAAGKTFKSSVFHSYTLDSRDDRISATKGIYGKLSQELAGLGGDAKFYKSEVEGQVSREVLSGISLSLGARTGLLYPLSSKSSLFPDRFQLGGPGNVRAFKANGLGPKDKDDSLGGEVYYSAGLSLISNIPTKGHWPVKTHAWVNAGRLDNLDSNRVPTFKPPSVSVGFGLIYRFDPIRVEVNVGMPVVASQNDKMRRGLQVGMGLEFM